MSSETLVLSRADLRQAVDLAGIVRDLHQAMAGYQEDGPAQRVRAHPSDSVTAMVLMPGLAPGVPAYTVKVHAKNAARRPALTGVICLHDLSSGDLLAVMDSGWLTALRTGVGAALGTHELARPGARHIGVVGAGVQGRAQLEALATLRTPASVQVHDRDRAAAETFAEHVRTTLAVSAQVHDSAAAVAAASELLLLATWSRTPVLRRSDVRPGTHITSLGADEPGKVELDAELFADALVVADDLRLAGAVLPRIDASLGQILRGEHPGREDDEQLTVYSPVGLPLQDCAAAWHAYRNAVARGLGTPLELEH